MYAMQVKQMFCWSWAKSKGSITWFARIDFSSKFIKYE